MSNASELQPVAENIWLLQQPLSFFGAQVGTRSTVIRLSDGRLWIHSPGPELPGVYKQLRQLGEVAYLVAPNAFHHMFLPKALQMFPEAVAYGTQGVQKKHPRLSLEPLETLPAESWNGEIEKLSVKGLRLDEQVFYHHASATLMLTDLLFNMRGEDFYTRLMLTLEGVQDKLACTRLVAFLLLKDRDALRQSCEAILDWDFERIIMCHGETVETEAQAAFAQAMAFTGLTF